MNPRITYHGDTNTLSVSWSHKPAEGCYSATSTHNTIWDMPPERWIELIGEVRRAIDELQKVDAAKQNGG